MKVLDGMAFAGFVSERGPPYRATDLFDDVSLPLPPSALISKITSLSRFLSWWPITWSGYDKRRRVHTKS